MTYGHIVGVPIGAHFSDRSRLYYAGLHRDIHQGICAGIDKNLGAESLVFSGDLEGDIDFGDLIYTSGNGARDGNGKFSKSQKLEGLNQSLFTNSISLQPVRVIRRLGFSFEYAGLYAVEDCFMGVSERGFDVCKFRLSKLSSPLPQENGLNQENIAERSLVTHYRLKRDSSVPHRIKHMYDFRCQICGIRIETIAGPYSEGAHLLPLGGSANGPDIEENVLSLCPNHHVMLDHGALFFTDEWEVLGRKGERMGVLSINQDHHLDIKYAQAHRKLMRFEGHRIARNSVDS